jgi:DNA primase
MIEINEITQAVFESRFTDSWGRDYLSGRFGVDLAGREHFRPGQPPAEWTNLVDHLRHRSVSDADGVTTGVATTASTGRLIDRFHDRAMFLVVHNSEVLGFVGRRELTSPTPTRAALLGQDPVGGPHWVVPSRE